MICLKDKNSYEIFLIILRISFEFYLFIYFIFFFYYQKTVAIIGFGIKYKLYYCVVMFINCIYTCICNNIYMYMAFLF